jgi:hypothetical protein
MKKIFTTLRADSNFKTMKKIILPFFFCFCLSFSASAQNIVPSASPTLSKGKELILYMPHVDKAKTLQTAVGIAETTKDIKAVAFCDDLKCLLLRIEGNHPEKADRVLEDLKIAGFYFVIKESATIQQVLNQSKNILNAENNWQ